ncbi:MAG: patatin-like phospholipase family protein, partial [Deltaproteobacteria bacterium]|nr:patatin-like phospholipase family protein [Deltaproteobacteria bacterium]
EIPEHRTHIALLVAPDVLEARRRELARLCSNEGKEREFHEGESHELVFEKRVSLRLFVDPEEALSAVKSQPFNVILIDNRGSNPGSGFAGTTAGKMLPELLAFDDPARSPNRATIFVILPKSEETAHHAFTVGALQLGGVIVDPQSLETAIESTSRTVRPSEPGKIALCLAGGGIEGMIYEMGALRALDAHLVGRSVADFDIFSGISAGAIISAFLANGVLPRELSDALHGKPSRVSPITRGMLFDPNLSEAASRIVGAAGDFIRGHWLRKPLDTAIKVTPTAFFSGEKMKWHLEKEFTKPGMTNDFNMLDKDLFVGVTDQDSGAHVTFGVDSQRDVPISHALRASAAMTPYYPPEKIKGRFYIDGIFTRTINLDVAVANGARLIICVDPLTPVQVDQPGYVSRRGGFFNTVQTVKAFIRTRLSEVIGRAGEAYPDVAVFVFSPTRQDLEQMSLTMMRYVYRAEIEEMAFKSVSQRIQRDFEWLSADFERHGFSLSRSPAG